ncbi:USPL1 isopeptidase, partial [Corythaeola cristata]|nr:USPL1 isopeptidase [Corythaeola cristata]
YVCVSRCRKTLTTFTNTIPDWHPLNAIHVGPCNNCSDRCQRRQMMLENVLSYTVLNGKSYLGRVVSFHNFLKVKKYSLSMAVGQMVLVILKPVIHPFLAGSKGTFYFSGTWLECDDLKGPYCRRHKRFEVPPSEIHIVTWEKKTSCVPEELNSQFRSKNIEDFALNNIQSNSTVLHCGFDNTVDKISAEHRKEDSVRTPDKKQWQVAEGESIVHHSVENLAHDDLITLMLEEIQVDLEGKSPSNGQMVENNPVVETGVLQQQESAFSPNSPYTGEFAATSLAMNNKCMLYENSSICLPLEELNPANTTPPIPKTHNPDPSDSSLARRTDDRTNLPNRKHGLNSELQLNKKLSPGENITQKSPDLEDASKIVVNSQVANSSAANNSFQPSNKDQKRGFVGSWVKKLLSKNTSFLPSSASALKNERSRKTPSMQKISEVRLPVKGASNFGGFQSRGTNKTDTPKSVVPQSNNTHPLSNFKGFSQSTRLPTASHTTIEGPTWNKSGSMLGTSGKVTQFRSPGCNSGKAEESDSDKTKKLRLKLLKKLNAKKKKLASLDRLAVEQMKDEKPVSGDVSAPSQIASHSNSELLQSFLRELQYQIDVADNESGFNANSVSGCTNHNNNDEILAELLSPTSTVASLEAPKSEDECMYMEMVDSSVATGSDEKIRVPHAATTGEDHNYHSPVKDNNLELHTISNASVKKLGFESPTREDILEDLFSISAPSSMAGDIDLPHFDETLFETW